MAKVIKAPHTPPPPPEPTPESEILRVYRVLDKEISNCTEQECWDLLAEEKAGRGRRLWLQRIYGRASVLRGKREAKEIREAARDSND
jgi:hypothetical protein